MTDLIENARVLMYQKTLENGAPVWELTETAVAKGRELSKKYGVDAETVVVALYLAHICFDKEVGGEVQKNHPELSASMAENYLEQWGCPRDKSTEILQSIRDHHKSGKAETLAAEVMKNAECYKFITWDKLRLYYEDLLSRGYSKEQFIAYVQRKFEQKKAVLTFPECVKDAEAGYLGIQKALASL